MEDVVNQRYAELAQELGHLSTLKERTEKRIQELKNEILGLDNLQGFIKRMNAIEAKKAEQAAAMKEMIRDASKATSAE